MNTKGVFVFHRFSITLGLPELQSKLLSHIVNITRKYKKPVFASNFYLSTQILGCSLRTLNRHLAELRARGYIRTYSLHHKRYIVYNEATTDNDCLLAQQYYNDLLKSSGVDDSTEHIWIHTKLRNSQNNTLHPNQNITLHDSNNVSNCLDMPKWHVQHVANGTSGSSVLYNDDTQDLLHKDKINTCDLTIANDDEEGTACQQQPSVASKSQATYSLMTSHSAKAEKAMSSYANATHSTASHALDETTVSATDLATSRTTVSPNPPMPRAPLPRARSEFQQWQERNRSRGPLKPQSEPSRLQSYLDSIAMPGLTVDDLNALILDFGKPAVNAAKDSYKNRKGEPLAYPKAWLYAVVNDYARKNDKDRIKDTK